MAVYEEAPVVSEGPLPGLRRFLRAHPFIVSTPLLGLLLASVTWPDSTLPPVPNLDSSWQLGLQMATQGGLDFGTEVIWTYGPLGFMQTPIVADGALWAVAATYLALLHIALCTSLVWAARRSPIGLVTAPVVLLLLDTGQIESSVVVALIWSVAAIDGDGSRLARRLVLFVGPVLAAIELLGKTNRGATVFVLLVVGLLSVDGRRRSLPVFMAIFAGAFALFWAITGQDFGEIPRFFYRQAQITSGFAEAHAAEDSTVDWERRVAPLAVAALFVIALRPRLRFARGQQIGTVALTAIFAFALFKQGFVRHDAAHGAVFFTTLGAGLYALIWRARQDAISAGAASLIATAALASLPINVVHADPIAHLRGLGGEIHALLSPARREALAGNAKATMKDVYAVEPKQLQLIGNRTVHIDPWQIGVAWAYELNWDPLPVFQDQQAYTEDLQQANVEALESGAGPERILRENTATVEKTYPTGAIDGQLGSFDPPRTSIAMLCHFADLSTNERWEVLGRVRNRCGTPRRLSVFKGKTGETITVPRLSRSELVVARVRGIEVRGIEALRALLYRPHGRAISVDENLYGFDPGTAASGLLLRAPTKLDFPAPFALAPQAEKISVSILKGGTAAIEVEFEAIPIRAAAPPLRSSAKRDANA